MKKIIPLLLLLFIFTGCKNMAQENENITEELENKRPIIIAAIHDLNKKDYDNGAKRVLFTKKS